MTSSPSNSVSTLTLQPPASQATPTSGADGVVALSWSASPSAGATPVSYHVLRRPAGAGAYAQIAGPLSGLTYSDDPNADGEYDYVIRADASGFTADSVARTGRSDSSGPTAPTDLTATSGVVGDGVATVTLSWTASSDPSGVSAYQVYYVIGNALNCGTASYALHGTQPSGTSYSFPGTSLKYYCFYLTARDTLGHVGPASTQVGPVLAQ